MTIGTNDFDKESLTRAILSNSKTFLERNAIHLSGGQKQRLSIARALNHKASLYILDDLSSSLDVTTEKKLLNELIKMDNTNLIISNSRSVMKRADHIIILKTGKIYKQGNYKQLNSLNDPLIHNIIH